MRYGRPTNVPQKMYTNDPVSQFSSENDRRAPWQMLPLGSAMLIGFFFFTLWQAKPLDATLPTDALPVMAMQEVQYPIETTTVAEPFGYYDGQWNLWEYIGDLFLSFLA